MRQAQYERSGRGKKRSGHSDRKGSGRYSSKNEEAKKEYKRDRRVFNPADDALLASMSSEERMKLYREKYAGAANTKASSGQNKGTKTRQTNVSYGNGKKSRKNGNRKNNGNNRSSAKQNQQTKKTNEKKSILGRLKSLFSKK